MAATPKPASKGGRGAPGRKRVPRAEREAQMLEAARNAYARNGLAASMDEIAAEAGISKPMLYSYFGSKEGLLAATAAAAGASLEDALRDLDAQGLAPDEQLWRGFNMVFDFVEEHREAWLLLYPSGDIGQGAIGTGAIRARESMGELLGQLFVQQAKESGMGEQAAQQSAMLGHVVTAATIASATWWLDHPDEPRDLVILRLMNLVWMGFGDLVKGRLWLPSG